MSLRPCLLLAALVASLLVSASPAHAGCERSSSLTQAQGQCARDAEEVRDLYATSASDGYTYRLETRCKRGDDCTRDERICRSEGRASGTWYVLFRTTVASGVTEAIGIVCLTPADERGLAVITPAMVRREMERLSWPTAELQVQPPDGQTLINFDTNFFTDNTAPTTRTITLLGQRVTIEAAPVEYTWHFGDGESRTTTSSGAAYPDLDVTHSYAEPGRVGPSVDTTYRGRYRLNDDGWQAIPGSLTVAGVAVALRVRAASPHLLGSDR